MFNNKQGAISAATTVDAGTVTTAQQNGIQLKPFNTAAGNTGELRFNELAAGGSNYVGFKAPDALAGDRIWTLPAADGTNGQILKTDGSGTLGWVSAGGSGTVTSVGFTAPSEGITVSGGPITGAGSITLSLANDLAAVEALSTTGGVERTGANTWATYTLTAAGKALIDDGDATAQRTTLGLGSLATASAVSGGAAGTITDDSITDADINSAAGIAQSKISGLTTSLSGKEPTITAGTTAQFYRGDKTWTDFNTAARGAVSITAPLTYDSGTGVFGLGQASGVADGYLSAANFVVFNNKQGAISAATTVDAGTVTTAQQNGIQLKPFNTAAGNTGELRFNELAAGGTNYVGFKAPDTLAVDKIWTLPAADGTTGQILKTDGSGNLGWVTGAAGNMVGSNNLSELTNATTARTSLGLGGLATLGAVGSTEITDLSIINTDINASAAIATSKLSGAVTSITGHGLGSLATLSAVGSTEITDDSIMNGDINASAAIADSKLATISTAGKVSGSAITSGTIGGSTVIATSGQISSTGNFRVAAMGGAATDLRFGDNDDSNYVGFKAPATVSADKIWTLPATDGTSGQVLSTNGSGVLSWASGAGGGGATVSFSEKSSDYTLTAADSSKYLIASGNWTTLTLPTAAAAGAGFIVTVKCSGALATLLPSGAEQIDGVAAPVTLETNATVQLLSSGSLWHIISSIGTTSRRKPEFCGADCYQAGAAMTSGLAYTGSGKLLRLVSGVWVQANGNNVLRVDGSDNWHLALNANGRSFSASYLDKTVADLAGRVCPTNVYVDDGNKVATGRCVYYDQNNPEQRLDATAYNGVTNQTTPGSYRLGSWNTAAGGNGTGASWYEGNIQTCANKGMRLPLLYETTAANPGSNKPTDPASPSWSTITTGVPALGGGYSSTWTSSAYSGDTAYYWYWSDTVASSSPNGYTGSVRCVVP